MTIQENWLRKKRKTHVTIIVGIISKGSIIIACDSQTTAGTAKRTDTSKITDLILDGRAVLVAESGDCTLSSRTVEILKEQFRTLKFDDYRKPADAAQNAVADVKRELIRLNNWDSNSAQKYLDDNPFSLMIAYTYERDAAPKPDCYLYVLNSVPGFATREKNFAAIGCGGTVGEFILSRARVNEMDRQQALVAAIYTVEEVKKVDTYCGGPTKAAILNGAKVWCSETESKPLVKVLIQTMENCEDKLKEKWKDLFEELLKITSEAYAKLSKTDD